ncbi:hypothetical protein Q73_01795 [Bacillus coahuilensis m2-6]|uniref:Uncharacterized protein n=1 Tax=Bacillus coahuilensis p1.1.43 TaxID=1150625 RepID=A0A147K5P8_9BACI|nr:hypothetical protein Q75_13510 [Bacillus coahuilensis p1.1.43]KUP09642.1 hypothetical protein Q73_01795 [Bacillus coahuilensis m2-6]
MICVIVFVHRKSFLSWLIICGDLIIPNGNDFLFLFIEILHLFLLIRLIGAKGARLPREIAEKVRPHRALARGGSPPPWRMEYLSRKSTGLI